MSPPALAPDSFRKSLLDSSIVFFTPPRGLQSLRAQSLSLPPPSYFCPIISQKRGMTVTPTVRLSIPFPYGRHNRFRQHPVGLAPWSPTTLRVGSVGAQARRSQPSSGTLSSPDTLIIPDPSSFVNRVTTSIFGANLILIVKFITNRKPGRRYHQLIVRSVAFAEHT
jgi:hypothetical protein